MFNSLKLVQNQMPFQANFSLIGFMEVSDQTVNKLSKEEQEELHSFPNKRRRREYLSSRLELRNLAKHAGILDNHFSIHKDEYGCPYGESDARHYFVSIAHTDKKVFCGFSADAAIGIDLEPADRPVPEKLKHRMAHPEEEEWLKKIETIRLWTIKEAYIKLRGQGLRLNMNEVRVQRSKEHFRVEEKGNKTAQIISFQAQEHWLAVAYYD